MPDIGTSGAVPGGLATLLRSGTAAGLHDWELLERFASCRGGGDDAQAAFATLVNRHGPMVLRTCRAVLRDPHRAEDSFQATFLVLANRAGSIRPGGSLGAWLHGVALRVAACDRSREARRLKHERRRAEMAGPPEADSLPYDDRDAALHEEIGRLPEAYRAVVVLCYLQGLTTDRAAERLGWPSGTVRRRLSWARDRLRVRLIRRGVDIPDVRAVARKPDPAAVAVPAPLAEAAARVATSVALGQSVPAGIVSARAILLMKGVLKAMTTRSTIWMAATLVAGLATVGSAAVYSTMDEGRAPRQDAPAQPVAAKAGPKADFRYPQLPPAVGADPTRTFEVLVRDEADGRPVPGATVRVYTGPAGEVRLTTDADGIARVPRPRVRRYTYTIDAWGPRHQSRRRDLSNSDPKCKPIEDRVVIDLDRGELTISGRVADEGGRPIPGVVVELQGMRKGEDHVAFFDVARTTDAEGRWSSAGMPKDLSTIGASFHHPDYYVEPGAGGLVLAQVKDGTQATTLKRGARVEGRVLDDQGRPIAGAELKFPAYMGWTSEDEAQADADGRFLFPQAFRPGELKTLLAWAPGRAPALTQLRAEPGRAPLEIALKAGGTVRGRAVDPSGRPIADAVVNAGKWSGRSWSRVLAITDADGRFALDGMPPDPVDLMIISDDHRAESIGVTPDDDEYTWTLKPLRSVHLEVKDAASGEPIPRFSIERGRVGEGGDVTWEPNEPMSVLNDQLFGRGDATLDADVPAWRLRLRAQGYRPYETRVIKSDEGAVALDAALERLALGEGGGPSGVVLGPDGTPLKGAEVMLSTSSKSASLNDGSWWFGQGVAGWSGVGTVTTDEQGRFTFLACDELYSLGAVHKLGYGEVADVRPAKDGPVGPHTIRLRPWGRIEGRVLSGKRPVPGANLIYTGDGPSMDIAGMQATGRTRADRDGRFAFEKVPPGPVQVYSYSDDHHMANRTFVDVPPGGVARAEIGGRGRPVVGGVAWPRGVDPSKGLGTSSIGLHTDAEQVPYPEDLKDHEERRDWRKRWWSSPEGVAHRHGYVLRGVEADADGAFRFEDVVPGTLAVEVEVTGEVDGRRRVFGKAETRFTMPEGGGDGPLDLGVITLEVQPEPAVPKGGAPAAAGAAPDRGSDAIRGASDRP